MDGQTLRKKRLETGAKGYEFAEAMGLTPATLSRYENDKAPIPRTVALAALYINERKRNTVAEPSAEVRLVEALREVVNGPRDN